MRCVGIHVCLRWIRSALSRLWCVELLIGRSVERDESSRDYRSNPKGLGQRTCDIISDQSRRATIHQWATHKGVTSHVERPFTGERLVTAGRLKEKRGTPDAPTSILKMPSIDHHQLEQFASSLARWVESPICELLAYKVEPSSRAVLWFLDTLF